MQCYGRREIFSDVTEVNSENIIKVLRQAFTTHQINANDCNFLLNYEAGQQPIMREKKYRSDIDCLCIDNVANEITEFKLGFNWGYPITLIQRGESDSGKDNKLETEAIALLNECYESEGMKNKTQELARFVEITGIGYVYIDTKTDNYDEGESYFSLDVLDPRCAFIVRSSRYIDHRPILGVTYRQDSNGNTYFTCFTADSRYEVVNLVKIINGDEVEEFEEGGKWSQDVRSGEINPLGIIPIVEYIRSHDRMGCFERQIPELDNLNLLASDFSNDVDQNTQAIWHCNDVRFPEDEETGEVVTPKTNDWLQTYTTKDGKTPFVTPLTVNYDYNGMLNNYITRRALILQKCSVPQRNDNSGGSTGIAMSDATGWSSAEANACKQQGIIESAKMNEVKVVLRAIAKSTHIESNNPMLSLKTKDIKPNIKRSKTYEMTTKANAYATLISHGIDGRSALEVVNMFEDVNQTYADSKKTIKEYQDSIFKKQESVSDNTNKDRIMQDMSDQEENSPMLNGQKKEDKE